MGGLIGGRFEIEREAGAGAMARVYRARDVSTGGVVALKLLNASTDQVMRRFAREVGALGEVTHPGIVGYVAHGRTGDGQAYLAMEWIEGETLDVRIERGPLSCREALVLARALASGLAAAHARGIVHRDIKPANIALVDRDVARPKLLDFGLVRDLDATLALTSTGDLLGTPLFMAPEQASSDPLLDARVDVYGLGAVLYACLTGRPPLVASTLVALLAKIVLEEPPPASKLVDGIPVVVEELLARLLAKQRDHRPADGAAAERTIVDALAGLDTSPRARVTGLPVREQRVCSIVLATATGQNSGPGLDATLGSFGGALALADGSSMVVFDGPETPATLAGRAARHALALRGAEVSVSLVTGRALLSGPTPVGEVIERAADQLERARGVVRIDGDTAGLIEGRFELAADAHGTLVVAERDELDSVRTLLGKPTRCLGRDRELAAIEGYFAEVVEESAARAVIVIAEPGVGKSRVAQELQRRLAVGSGAPDIIVARCESISEQSPFFAVASALRRRDDANDEFLRELAGAPAGTPSERLAAARENPTLMFESIRAAWTTWLAAACARRPVLIVVEDLHWADESSLQLIDAALGALAGERFMVLALARPEVRDRKPFASRRPHELRLDPLGRRASERMVRDALGPQVADDVVASVIARAEGNALFLEELIRAVAQRDGGELPVGVIGTVQRRFDQLSVEARAVLRAASVYGERFTASAVAALQADARLVEPALAELVAEELIALHAEGYAFRHALVREAAYALIAAEDRVIGHALAGRYLAREAGQDAAVIARHFELGNVRADAARWYALAAERALERNDIAGALAHAERAQGWTDDAEALGALDLIVAEAEFWRGRLEQTRTAAQRAAARLPTATAAWFEAAGLVLTASGQLGDNDLVEAWLDRAMALEPTPEARSAYVLCLSRGSSQLVWSDRVDLARAALGRALEVPHEVLGPSARARLQFARAYDYMQDGRVDLCTATLHEVAALYTRNGAHRDALQMSMLGHMLSMFGGQIDTAHPTLVSYVAEAERLEARYLADWTRWEVACSLLIQGDRAAADEVLASVPPAVKDQPLFRSVGVVLLAWCEFRRGDLDGLARVLAEAPEIAYSRFRAATACFAAYVDLQRGDAATACQRAREAVTALVVAPGLNADGCLCGFAPALETLIRAGAADAREALEAHIARLERLAGPFTPEMREGFMQRVPWNRHILALRERCA